MKKIFIILAAVLCVAVLASCSLSKDVKEDVVEEQEKSKNLVKVYFDSVTTKSLKTSYGDFEVTYLLTAVPQFERNGRTNLAGKVSNQVLGTSKSTSFDAGYFEQGEWNFTLDAVLRKTEGQTVTTSSVIASASMPGVYISPTSNHVEFTLTDTTFAATDTGSINIAVKVPQVAAKTGESPNFNYGVTMQVYLDNAQTPTATTFTITEAADVAADGTDLLLFSGALSDIKAGSHTVKLVYLVNKTGGGTETVCSQAIDVYVIPGAPALISGTMLNGDYIKGTISVTYVTDTWTIGVGASKTSIMANEETQLTCTVTGATGTEYKWYVNGELKENTNTDKKVFKFTPESQGIYNIACSAKVGSVTKSSSIYIYAEGVKKTED